MSESRRQIEAMLFKPVPGGFVYRAPNPWIFGRADHYVVNEQQKAELLRIVVAPRPLIRVAVIVAGVLLWGVAMGTVGWAFSGHEDPTVGDAVVMIVATFAALFLALHLALRRQLRRNGGDPRRCDAHDHRHRAERDSRRDKQDNVAQDRCRRRRNVGLRVRGSDLQSRHQERAASVVQ
jgi:hypothetical protein